METTRWCAWIDKDGRHCLNATLAHHAYAILDRRIRDQKNYRLRHPEYKERERARMKTEAYRQTHKAAVKRYRLRAEGLDEDEVQRRVPLKIGGLFREMHELSMRSNRDGLVFLCQRVRE